jgi:hypothetical protein
MKYINLIASFIKGLIWILFSPKETYNGFLRMQYEKVKLKDMGDVVNLLNQFRFRRENNKNTLVICPLIEFAMGLKGSDFNSSILVKWAFKQIGIRGNIYNLESVMSNHKVFISDNKDWMVSNASFVRLDPYNWEEHALKSGWHANMHYKIAKILL